MKLGRIFSLCCLLGGLLTLPREARAVRPFVTEDARVVEPGQLEIETWGDLLFSDSQVHAGHNLVANISPLRNWEISLGGGWGLEGGSTLTLANPVLISKYLFQDAELDGLPGFAFVVGATLPWGKGELYDPATSFSAIAPVTFRFWEDWLHLHLNLGLLASYQSRSAERAAQFSPRPFWGVGLDAGVFHPDVRLILESYAGDPFEPLGPVVAFQGGGRWIASELINIDLTFGTQPRVDPDSRETLGWESWAQVGLRLLFDLVPQETAAR